MSRVHLYCRIVSAVDRKQHTGCRGAVVFMLSIWLIIWSLGGVGAVVAEETGDPSSYDNGIVAELFDSPAALIDARIREPFNFSGLAGYYQAVSYYRVGDGVVEQITDSEKIVLQPQQWLAVVGRFKVLLLKAPGMSLQIVDEQLQFDQPANGNPSTIVARIVLKNELAGLESLLDPDYDLPLDQLRYAYLWPPLAWLTKQVETALVAIQTRLVGSWGWAIVLLALFIKLLLLPVSLKTASYQRRVSQIQAQLAPELARIKAEYDGEEAHNRLMAAHKALGVSPFYALKPILGSFVQIPLLIAVFNALAEMPQLGGQSFLWISNLAYPDAIAPLGRAIPLFGSTLNLLPVLMTLVALFATMVFSNPHASVDEFGRQKRNLYLMAVLFFLLFYPFPAAMVLYWMSANAVHTVQQHLAPL